jgi:hypothetical protein
LGQNGIGVRTVVFEFDYIDKDYTEDYARFYSRCFRHYPSKCVRLHFFKYLFDKAEFKQYLLNQENKNIQDSYAGFVVLRPLPLTIFGKTCLLTYSDNKEDGSKRYYPTIRKYHAHLFGIKLTVSSIAYQEQDNAFSACATSALWVAFQATSKMFGHSIPSPYEITLSASKYIINKASSIGLYPAQMAYAIKELGLQPTTLGRTNASSVKAILYAYLRCKIPVIVGVDLFEEDEEFPVGSHGITITGYDQKRTLLPPPDFVWPNRTTEEDNKEIPFYMESSRIQELYVHDDQIGPFARMVFEDGIGGNYRLSTSWGRFDDNKVFDKQKGNPRDKRIEAAPTLLMIPLYHKIRIPFELILRIVNEFSSFTNLAPFVVWDIYLTTACKLKQMFRKYNGKINEEERLKLLTYNYPRYIWVVDARLMGMERPEDFPPDFSYYFDATDIPHSDFFLFALHWEPDSRKLIKDMIQEVAVNEYESHQVNQIIDYYKDPNKLNPNQTSSLLKIDPLPKILPTSTI